MINRVILRGFVANEPLVRATERGKFATIRLATIEHIKRPSGQIVEHTEWHSVAFRGEEAEVVDRSVRIGMAIHVEGVLRHREWEDRSGKVHKVSEISASLLKIVEGGLEGYALPKTIQEAIPRDYHAVAERQKATLFEVKAPAEDPDNLPF